MTACFQNFRFYRSIIFKYSSEVKCTLITNLQTLNRATTPLARYGSVRFLHGTLPFLNGTVRFLHGTFRFLHGTVRFLNGTVRLLHGTFRILHRTVRFYTPRFVERYANQQAELVRLTAKLFIFFFYCAFCKLYHLSHVSCIY